MFEKNSFKTKTGHGIAIKAPSNTHGPPISRAQHTNSSVNLDEFHGFSLCQKETKEKERKKKMPRERKKEEEDNMKKLASKSICGTNIHTTTVTDYSVGTVFDIRTQSNAHRHRILISFESFSCWKFLSIRA